MAVVEGEAAVAAVEMALPAVVVLVT